MTTRTYCCSGTTHSTYHKHAVLWWRAQNRYSILTTSWRWYWTPISNPLTSWERGYVGVPGISLSLYLCSPICLYVCILLYDVYNATPACIIYSYSCPLIACVHTSTLVLRTYYTVLRASPSLCMLPHTYTHTMYVHLCTIQYTLRTTIYGTLPPLTHLHVRS